MLSADPKLMKSNTDKDDPSLESPYVLIADPNLYTDLQLVAEDSAMASSKDSELLNIAAP
jgi:hypothetical protein